MDVRAKLQDMTTSYTRLHFLLRPACTERRGGAHRARVRRRTKKTRVDHAASQIHNGPERVPLVSEAVRGTSLLPPPRTQGQRPKDPAAWRCDRLSVKPSATRVTRPVAQMSCDVPLGLFPTSCWLKAGASGCCSRSTRPEMPASYRPSTGHCALSCDCRRAVPYFLLASS